MIEKKIERQKERQKERKKERERKIERQKEKKKEKQKRERKKAKDILHLLVLLANEMDLCKKFPTKFTIKYNMLYYIML